MSMPVFRYVLESSVIILPFSYLCYILQAMQIPILEALKRLGALHTLVLMGAHMMNLLQMQSFVREVFRASPLLVWFVFAGREWNRSLNHSTIPVTSCDWNMY